MRRLMPSISLILTGVALTLAVPPTALGFECTNAGAGSNAPDDHGVSSRTACGNGADASGVASTAVGGNAVASGGTSTALGLDATASGGASTAVGRSATVSGDRNTTLGFAAVAFSPHTNATAIGYLAQVEQSNALVLGSIPGVNDPLDTNEYVDVGIGTSTPVAPLHIQRNNASAQLLVEETNGTVAPRSLFDLINNGPIGFNMENTASGDRWRFAAQTTGFRISLAGTGGPEFEVLDNGDAVLKGTLTENSDVNVKRDIEAVDAEAMLSRLLSLPIAEWRYRGDAADSRHVGPMAQDFYGAFGLGRDPTLISPRDMAGVAMAAIQAQQQRIAELETQQAEKDAEIAALQDQTQAQRRKVKGRQAAMEAQQAEFEAQQERIAELAAQQTEKDTEIAALQARLEELGQIKAQVAALQAQLLRQVALQ